MHPPDEDTDRPTLSARDHDPSPLRDAVLSSAAASRVGFDWGSPDEVLRALRSEVTELEEVLTPGPAADHELGDVLLAACNLARHLRVDPHAALVAATQRFEARFGRLERDAASAGVRVQDESLAALEARWQAAKAAIAAERGPCSG